MSENAPTSTTITLPPVTQRGFTNLMVTGFLYPYTMLPITPLLGIYRTGKATYNYLEGTPLGKNEIVRLAATTVATPFASLALCWPMGIMEGTELISNQVARLGLDKGVETVIENSANLVFGTIGRILNGIAPK